MFIVSLFRCFRIYQSTQTSQQKAKFKYFLMDSDIISFKDLNARQKLFQEELEDFVKIGNEIKSKNVVNVVPLNKKKQYFENVETLSEVAKQQQTQEFTLLKEQKECNKHIADISVKIENMQETLQKLKNEESLGNDEIKHIKKPLLKAIKKYSTNFNLAVDLKKQEPDTLVASVNFFNKKDSLDFLIDRKSRTILEESLGNDEIKHIKKPLLKAIKKYSTNFNLAVDLKKQEPDTLVASVNFFNKKDSLDFLIDRKSRTILDFNAKGFSKKEIQELKNTAQTRRGLNVDLILCKLRDRI